MYQDDRVADSGNYKPKKLQSNKSPNTLSKKTIDSSKEGIKTNIQTYSFYPLALNDYKYSLYNESEADSYDYRTIHGITNIIDLDEKVETITYCSEKSSFRAIPSIDSNPT